MKIPYNYLTEDNKKNIIETFYDSKNLCFKEISELLGFSERAISRVLKENNINTKRKNRYTLNENYFNNIDTQDKAYILGLLYADGFVGDGSVVLSKNSSYYKGQGFIKKYEYPTIQIIFLGTEAFIRKLAEKMNLNHVLIRNTKTLLIKELRISSKKESSRIFGFLYKDADIFLERKYKKWLSFESAYMKKFI